jgi:hypothetical protein
MKATNRLLVTALVLSVSVNCLQLIGGSTLRDLPERAAIIADDLACQKRAAQCYAAFIGQSALTCSGKGG